MAARDRPTAGAATDRQTDVSHHIDANTRLKETRPFAEPRGVAGRDRPAAGAAAAIARVAILPH